MNQLIIVGKLTENPEIKEVKNKKVGIINVAVQRPYKNEDGIYETDFIDCVLWEGIATNVNEYCHKGDVVGVKGKLQSEDGTIKVVAEKVTFLSSRKKDEENGN